MRIISLFLILSIYSCFSSNGSEANLQLTQMNASENEQKYNYFTPIRLLKQPKSMDCWATALTMLYSWKNNDNSIKISDLLKEYGEPYPLLFETNAGISVLDEEKLYQKAGLTVLKRVNPLIKSWYDLLKAHGPLSITVAIKSNGNPSKRFIHALIINGIKGDGSNDGTLIDYIDPGDGKQWNVKFSKFIKLYEGASNWPLQIIYWP